MGLAMGSVKKSDICAYRADVRRVNGVAVVSDGRRWTKKTGDRRNDGETTTTGRTS